jgi:hypothetical protein
MKNTLLLMLLFAVCQGCATQKPAIVYNAGQLIDTDSIGEMKRIAAPVGRNIAVVYTNGERRKIRKSDVWGYVDNRGRMFRLHKGHAYKVFMRGDFVKYERRMPGTNVYRRLYSADLDSPVYLSKRKARRLN